MFHQYADLISYDALPIYVWDQVGNRYDNNEVTISVIHLYIEVPINTLFHIKCFVNMILPEGREFWW